MHPSQTRETAFNKDEGKHGQREILESRDIRQVHTKRRVEVQCQNRDLLIRDVCTCLAHWGWQLCFSWKRGTMVAKIITVLTRYRPIVLELI